MDQVLYDYELNATTWVYLASLLSIAVFFKFNRVWSVRNLDLLGLIAYAPGLLLIAPQFNDKPELQQLGYVWLFTCGALFLIRILIDPLMVRRPLLEPNLLPGGMAFLGLSLLLFLMINVLTYRPSERDLAAARQVDIALATDVKAPNHPESIADHAATGNRPGYFLMMWLPSVSTAGRRRINAWRLTIFCTPMDNATFMCSKPLCTR